MHRGIKTGYETEKGKPTDDVKTQTGSIKTRNLPGTESSTSRTVRFIVGVRSLREKKTLSEISPGNKVKNMPIFLRDCELHPTPDSLESVFKKGQWGLGTPPVTS